MTAKMIRAIKALPDDYVLDGMEFTEFNGWIVAVNGRIGLFPICTDETHPWAEMVFILKKEIPDARTDPH